MKKIKLVLVVLLLVLAGLTAATELYFKAGDDTTPPVISCDQEVLEVSVKAEEKELLQGVTAQDNRDGDLTGQIVVDHISTLVTADTAKISYVVFDSANNVGKLTRTIRYTDYETPRFQLSGPLRYQVGNTVTLLDRLSAQDVLDGDISNTIRITTQNLNIAMEGIYSITLQVTNSLGDTSILPLSVIIQAGSGLPEVKLSEYLIYMKTGESFAPASYLWQVTDPGRSVSKDDVTIDSNVDVDKAGVYEVYYRYEGQNGTGLAILTVVVE